mmetsp:Transcript_25450/g.61554  ORF Transcript_25450/g.61554 Transcript_25450/m.61554 type:complete len:683 (-) Transcript_25450:45-2093(-)
MPGAVARANHTNHRCSDPHQQGQLAHEDHDGSDQHAGFRHAHSATCEKTGLTHPRSASLRPQDLGSWKAALDALHFCNLRLALKQSQLAQEPFGPSGSGWSQRIVSSVHFHCIITATICVNTMVMGLQLDVAWEPWETIWQIVEMTCLGVFVVEMVVKVHAHGAWAYISDVWNIMDVVVVMLALADVVILITRSGNSGSLGNLSTLRLLRGLRLLRLLKLTRKFRELWMIVQGILNAFKTMAWTTILILVGLYGGAVLVVTMVGRDADTYPGYSEDVDDFEMFSKFNPYEFFGTITRAMFTLFSLVLLTEFAEIARPMFEKQPGLIMFVILYIALLTFGVLNVLIGVIVESVMDSGRAMDESLQHEQAHEQLQQMEQLCELLFPPGCPTTVDELQETCSSMPQGFTELLDELGCPPATSVQDLLDVFDINGDGVLDLHRAVTTLYRITTGTERQRWVHLQAGINLIRRDIHALSQHFGVHTSAGMLNSELGVMNDAPEPPTSPTFGAKNGDLDVISSVSLPDRSGSDGASSNKREFSFDPNKSAADFELKIQRLCDSNAAVLNHVSALSGEVQELRGMMQQLLSAQRAHSTDVVISSEIRRLKQSSPVSSSQLAWLSSDASATRTRSPRLQSSPRAYTQSCAPASLRPEVPKLDLSCTVPSSKSPVARDPSSYTGAQAEDHV